MQLLLKFIISIQLFSIAIEQVLSFFKKIRDLIRIVSTLNALGALSQGFYSTDKQ